MKSPTKRYYLVALFLFLLLIFLPNAVNAKASFEEVENDKRYVEVKVKAEKTIKHVFIYKYTGEGDSGKYILFYKKLGENNTETTCIIPENRLSTEGETKFKVVVVEEDGERTAQDITGKKLEPYPSILPSETARPSWSPSPIPTKPTPTTTASSSPSASGSAQPTESGDPGTSEPGSSAGPSASSDPSASSEPSP